MSTPLDAKVKDVYSGKLVPARTVEELDAWLRASYATLLPGQERCIVRLCAELEEGNDPAWWAATCGITIESTKKRSRKK